MRRNSALPLLCFFLFAEVIALLCYSMYLSDAMGIWQLLVVVKARSPDVARHLGHRYSSTFQAIGHVVHLLVTVVIMLIAWQVREAARAAYGIPDEASTPLHYITLYYIASRTRRAQRARRAPLSSSFFVRSSFSRPAARCAWRPAFLHTGRGRRQRVSQRRIRRVVNHGVCACQSRCTLLCDRAVGMAIAKTRSDL